MTSNDQFDRLGDAGAWYRRQIEEGNWHATVTAFLNGQTDDPMKMALPITDDATAWWMLDTILLALRERADTLWQRMSIECGYRHNESGRLTCACDGNVELDDDGEFFGFGLCDYALCPLVKGNPE